MSRAKQTAPKSTKGKAPRMHLNTMAARLADAAAERKTNAAVARRAATQWFCHKNACVKKPHCYCPGTVAPFVGLANTRRTLIYWSGMPPFSVLSEKSHMMWWKRQNVASKAQPCLPYRRPLRHTLSVSSMTPMSVPFMQGMWQSRSGILRFPNASEVGQKCNQRGG